ncbi:hypothetical protein KKC87_01835, partial [Patescibacteria group bacterium]|nr:hypothetical protein [Patescibacteria group bacterium]
MEPQNQKISTWCFILGRETLLSAAELKAVFEMENIAIERMTSNKNLFVETHNKIDAVKMINQLGGTIKICEKIECGNSKLEIGNFLCSHIADGKIIFSVSGDIDNKFGLEIKKLVKNLGRSVRFVEPKNTATIIHNHLVEKGADLNILPEGVFLTRAIQPIESFGKRDFGRPGRDDLSGMLPPKLAMIMVNLARVPREAVILDPFCGSGTILTEAMLLGYGNLIGTDSSEKAIEDTKKNMAWMKQNFQFSI